MMGQSAMIAAAVGAKGALVVAGFVLDCPR